MPRSASLSTAHSNGQTRNLNLSGSLRHDLKKARLNESLSSLGQAAEEREALTAGGNAARTVSSSLAKVSEVSQPSLGKQRVRCLSNQRCVERCFHGMGS